MNMFRMRAKIKTTNPSLSKRAITGAVLALVMAVSPVMTARADTFDDQIHALQDQVGAFQAQAGQLRAQADDLQSQLGALDAQSQAVQAQISANELKKEQLDQQIQQTSDRIVQQKQGLAQNLRSMYVESDISPLEMVASSKSISDFIDKQEYRNRIRDAIQQSLKQIQALQAQLTQQRQDVEHVLADQKAMQAQLASQEDQKNQLLAETQGQESAYQQLVADKNSKISELQAEQRAANARFFGGAAAGTGPACGGGYPGIYCEAPKDTVVDNWGMYNRECVSYTAWKVWQVHGYNTIGWGNANMWPGAAEARGLSVNGNPQVGDVAIMNIGPYGHSMYVESVNGDGTISVSQYNADFEGHYSTMRIRSSGLQFIHF